MIVGIERVVVAVSVVRVTEMSSLPRGVRHWNASEEANTSAERQTACLHCNDVLTRDWQLELPRFADVARTSDVAGTSAGF
jgi:hypothetical protein